MELSRFWSRTMLRRGWRSYTGLVVLLGITGGLSLFALAGARRTQSAYPRYLRSVHASTMAIDTGQYDPATLKRIAAFPQVVKSQTYVAPLVAHVVRGKPIFEENFEALGSLDGRFFDQDRFTATQGRLPNPRRVDEVAVNQAAAKAYGYHVGQHLDLGTYDPASITEDATTNPPAPAVTTKATITGVGLFPNEVLQDDTDVSPLVLLTPAYTRTVLEYVQYEWQGLTLEHGDADVDAVKARYLKLLHADDPTAPEFLRVTSVTTFHVEQAMRPLSIALGLFGAIAALACVVLVGQALARQIRNDRPNRLILRALGATTRGSTAAVAIGPTLTVLTGTALAVILATVASPLMPLGKVRVVEVASGFDFDATVFAGGGLLIVLALIAVVWIAAWRAVPVGRSQDSRADRPSMVVRFAERVGLPATGVNGLRLAFEPGRGSTAVPVRSVMVGVAIAVLALVSAVTFGSSLNGLVDTPRLYGWDWDATLVDGGGYGEGHADVAARVFGHDRNIAGYAGGYFGSAAIDGANTALLGVTAGARVHPPILTGRFIKSANEIVMGSRTLSELHAKVGDTVALGTGRSVRRLRIVGTATLPTVGIIHGQYTSLGVGAMVERTLVPGYQNNRAANGYVGPNVWFVKFRPGVDTRAAQKQLRREMAPIGSEQGSLVLVSAQRPAEIVNATTIGAAPMVLAGALAVAALASLGLALASSVRRRRRDLALLKTLGFTRRQIGATVRWQAGATVIAGLLIGAPLGVLAGRFLWRAFAEQLDVVPNPSTPYLTIMLMSAIAIVVALGAAAIPARAARRVHPAAVLQTE